MLWCIYVYFCITKKKRRMSQGHPDDLEKVLLFCFDTLHTLLTCSRACKHPQKPHVFALIFEQGLILLSQLRLIFIRAIVDLHNEGALLKLLCSSSIVFLEV